MDHSCSPRQKRISGSYARLLMSSSNGCTIPHPPGCEAVLMSLTMTMEGPVLQTSRNGFFRKAMSSLKARGKTSPQMFALHRNTQAGEYGSLSDTGAISLPSVKPLFTCQGERPLLHFQAQAQPAVPFSVTSGQEQAACTSWGAACFQ